MDWIARKLGKLGCFFLIALVMIAVTAVSRWILEGLHFDKRTSEKIGSQVGDWIGWTFLILFLVVGFVTVVRQLRREGNSRTAMSGHGRMLPPPLPAIPGLAPTVERATACPDQSPSISPIRWGRGCLIVAGILVILIASGIGVIYHMASEYEKRPKQPGELELIHAQDFTRSFKDREATGNDGEATKLAEKVARMRRLASVLMFTESKGGFGDQTEGRFLTYCFRKRDSVAFIIQVPRLGKYSDEAKLTLEEEAWRIATESVGSDPSQPVRLAVGIRGLMDYSSILTGAVNHTDPLKGIETRHPLINAKPLWPYFIPQMDPESGQNR